MNYLMPFLLVSFFLLVVFFITTNLVIFYIKRNAENKPQEAEKSPVSILIAMKNESVNIQSLINSLRNLDYPADKFETILVDDNSDDNTFETCKKAIEDLPDFKLIKAEKKKMPGKKGALTVGLEHCAYENIALTDADCTPQKKWLSAVSAALSKFDVAFGASPLLPEKSFISRFASYESGKNQIFNFAALVFGIPVSATGRNFAYKKSSFAKTGGYEKTLETLSGDDDLFLREAYKKKLKVGFINGRDAAVISRAPKNSKEYFSQRARHVKTSHHYSTSQKIFTAVYFLGDFLSTYAFILSGLNVAFLLPSILKFKIAFTNRKKFGDFFGKNFSFSETFIFELVHPAFATINFALSVFTKEKWD
jgi:cellulose synthase/poly-beta-1,6-N-acetylglucosamine synthase-like glycosyltransferase